MTRFVVERLEIPEVLIIRPKKIADSRGHFVETFREADFFDLGVKSRFVQDNQSVSKLKGTVRGLHFQREPQAQAKLVRATRGSIFDVAVDLRANSDSRGHWCSAILKAEDGDMIFVPAGFAHGFCTLENDTHVSYKVDQYYSPQHDAGILWNDADIAIRWPVAGGEAIISDKDASLPQLKNIKLR